MWCGWQPCGNAAIKNNHFTEMCSGSKSGSYLRLIDSCITHIEAQGPSRTYNEGTEEDAVKRWAKRASDTKTEPNQLLEVCVANYRKFLVDLSETVLDWSEMVFLPRTVSDFKAKLTY